MTPLRQQLVRPPRILLLLLATAMLGACTADPEEEVSGSGGCAAADITAEPTTASPGDTVMLHGTGFRYDCYDIGTPGETPGPPEPTEPFPISLSDGSTVTEVATAEPDAEGEFDLSIVIPDSTAPGEVRIVRPNLWDPTLPDNEELTITIEAAS